LPADYPVVADFDNDNSRELIIVSHERGFIGNTIALEGTLKEFNVNLQVGSNSGQGFRLEVGDTRSMALKISSDKPTGNPGVAGAAYVKIPNVTNGISSAAVEYSVDVMDEKKATAAIEVYNNAILQVAAERSKLGAIQNRLEKTIANLDNTAENLTGARSRILDTDMALEMSEFTKFNILQQAGTAMLSQANQQPQMMLKLLNA
jgi:Flagellin and related hook-associated proteins